MVTKNIQPRFDDWRSQSSIATHPLWQSDYNFTLKNQKLNTSQKPTSLISVI